MPSQPRVAPGRAAQQVDALPVANWPFINAHLVRISAEPGIEDEPGALVVSGARWAYIINEQGLQRSLVLTAGGSGKGWAARPG
jgi:hypothetical protein